MKVALVTHPSSYAHVGPAGHPERPDRLDAAVAGVEQSGLDVIRVEAEAASDQELEAIHSQRFIADLREFCEAGGGRIDADTYAVPGSWEAAVHAAGAGRSAVDTLEREVADVAFVAVRPPGHHAEASRAMGFCLLNNVAITAAHLADASQRVAVVDWDVHHGNGTQRSFYADDRVLYVSVHQSPWYPGTGWIDETGVGAGAGFTVNVPMPARAGGPEYTEAMTRVVVPILEQYEPDWLLVSAGYDGHHRDPLALIDLTEDDYASMATMLADVVPARRTVFLLEGGYDLDAVSDSVAATLQGHGETTPRRGSGFSKRATPIDQVVETLSPYWDLV